MTPKLSKLRMLISDLCSSDLSDEMYGDCDRPKTLYFSAEELLGTSSESYSKFRPQLILMFIQGTDVGFYTPKAMRL